MLLWIVRHLLRVSGQLQTSEAQARRDIVALQQAREAAEVADRAKMNFMSVVSHELRTPLTVILGYARLGKNLRKMPPAQRLEEVSHLGQVDPALLQSSVEDVLRTATTGMEKIERSGEHLLFLVNELLDYAKMETGRLEVDPEICDVLEVLNPVVDQMRTLTDEKGLKLEATMAPCLMLADVTRTRQIVINLIGNAIKFTDAGKVSVVVNESEDKVHIEVSDTGTGIAPHELEKIFDAFHQADGSFSRSAAGTGLGLSVARELAHLEGGTISVRSEVGVGSTFTLSLQKSKSPDPS
ncbi:sensor histidine kinase [Loktanella salsilacus]|uniref:sensor histidine kinase n=1 Tax=Loktanella salsilacus TaxID=195913 RepID=UPI001FE06796|nr:ATP-binding protein [Loktanella salsilacus]